MYVPFGALFNEPKNILETSIETNARDKIRKMMPNIYPGRNPTLHLSNADPC